MRMRKEQLCYVLIRRDPDTRIDLYKIGISANPWYRARECHAELLWCEPGGRRRERELHREFGHLRHSRPDLEGASEWFIDEDGSIAEYLQERQEAWVL